MTAIPTVDEEEERARLVRDGQNLGRPHQRFESDPRAQEDADDDHIIVRTI